MYLTGKTTNVSDLLLCKNKSTRKLVLTAYGSAKVLLCNHRSMTTLDDCDLEYIAANSLVPIYFIRIQKWYSFMQSL